MMSRSESDSEISEIFEAAVLRCSTESGQPDKVINTTKYFATFQFADEFDGSDLEYIASRNIKANQPSADFSCLEENSKKDQNSVDKELPQGQDSQTEERQLDVNTLLMEPLAFDNKEDLVDILYGFDLDEYSADDHLGRNLVSISGTKITRESGAKRAALLLEKKYGFSVSTVELLSDYFLENGWTAAKSAIDFHFARGMNDAELELALHLRHWWESCIELSQSSGKYSYAKLSWGLALNIIRTFNSYPDKVELEVFLSDCLQGWCESFRLRDEYRSFKDYVTRICESRFSSQMVVPDMSLVDSGFHEQFEDDFSCSVYAGIPIAIVPYERAFQNRYGAPVFKGVVE